jgi:serine/threonine protein kinase
VQTVGLACSLGSDIRVRTGETPDDLYRRVLRGDYKAPSFVSRESRDLLRRMLTVDPRRRATLVDVLAHSWVETAFTASSYGYSNE